MTVPALTKERAPAVVRAAVAERDAIQANLLELDGSFGKRLLAGATLSGETRRRWEVTAASLVGLWQAYSAPCWPPGAGPGSRPNWTRSSGTSPRPPRVSVTPNAPP